MKTILQQVAEKARKIERAEKEVILRCFSDN
jgi:hypothetical protein